MWFPEHGAVVLFFAGIDHVDLASATLDEDAMLKELEDPGGK